MTTQEAEKVLEILLIADGGCEYCVSRLLETFCEKFPEFSDLAQRTFRNTFNKGHIGGLKDKR